MWEISTFSLNYTEAFWQLSVNSVLECNHFGVAAVYFHYSDVIMSAKASQIIGVSMVCWTVCSGADQRKIKALRHWPLWGEFTGDRWNYPHKGPVMLKMFPFDDVIMNRGLEKYCEEKNIGYNIRMARYPGNVVYSYVILSYYVGYRSKYSTIKWFREKQVFHAIKVLTALVWVGMDTTCTR